MKFYDIISLQRMISSHFTGIIFSHGFITLISTLNYVIMLNVTFSKLFVLEIQLQNALPIYDEWCVEQIIAEDR